MNCVLQRRHLLLSNLYSGQCEIPSSRTSTQGVLDILCRLVVSVAFSAITNDSRDGLPGKRSGGIGFHAVECQFYVPTISFNLCTI